MQDSEILATVYRWMSQSLDRCESVAVMGNRLADCKEYIDEQWKLQDEHKEWQSEVFAKNDDGQRYNMDVKETERHRGLEIGPDGTVTDLK
ncbi:hypothetical protein CMI37_12230 [Candidatus Pacearchaeota archaeon]|nr:hypothetical protein [Candidatus Pacearchaeota archaeon]